MRRSTGLVLLGMLAACNTSPSGPVEQDPPSFALSSSGFWAGSNMVITSTSFAEGDPAVRLTLDGASVPVTRTGPESFSAVVPPTMSGSVVPVVTLDDQDYPLPAVAIYGPDGSHAYPGIIAHPVPSVVEWRRPTLAAVLVDFEPGLSWIDLDAATVHSFPGPLHVRGMSSPGPTPDPDVWLLKPEPAGNVERWRLSPVPQRLDTLPRGSFSAATRTVIAAFGESTLAYFLGDNGGLWNPDGASGWAQSAMMHYEGDRRIGIAPGGARAALRTSGGYFDFNSGDGRGVAVFDVTDGSIAYVLPVAWRSVDAFDFSADGVDLGIVTGTSVTGLSLLKVIAADDGALRWETDFGTSDIFGIGFDPGRPYLYAALKEGGGMAVAVLDRATGQEVARLAAPCGLNCRDEAELVVSPGGALYVVETAEAGDGVVATRFSLPPIGSLP